MTLSQKDFSGKDTVKSAEDTLRVIANLPAPEGLTDRVNSRLRTAPRTVRLLSWTPGAGGWGYGSALRGAAAAAIVCVVAGGGWRIYSRVQPAPGAGAVALPAPGGPARGGFSIGGSVHTPDPRPVLQHQPALVEKDGVGTNRPPQSRDAVPPIPNNQPASDQAKKQGKGRPAPSATPPARPK